MVHSYEKYEPERPIVDDIQNMFVKDLVSNQNQGN